MAQPPAPSPPDAVDPLTALELREALELQGARRMAESAVVLERVLVRDPGNPDALHLLGVARFAAGEQEEGIALVQRAVEAAPGFGSAAGNLGMMLRLANRAGEALGLLRGRVAARPQDGVTRRALGSALLAEGDLDGAAEQFGLAVRLDPEDAASHAGLALARLRQQRFHEAEASLRQALGLRPADAELHMNLGVVLRLLGKLDEAVGSLRVALLLRPDYLDARFNLGVLQLQRGRAEEAAENMREVLAADPGRGDAHMVLGQSQLRTGDPAALDSLQRAVETMADPALAYDTLAPVLSRLGNIDRLIALERLMAGRSPGEAGPRLRLARVLALVGRLDEAAEAAGRALAIDPGSVNGNTLLGAVRYVQGRADEARQRYETVLALSPGNLEARMALAVLQLTEGNFAEGLAGFEARLEAPGVVLPAGARLPPLAQAGSLAGKQVLLLAEQGLGDTLQFVRYARLLAERGAVVTLAVPAPLVPLLEGIPGVAAVVAQGGVMPEVDFVCPMMSLPLVFGTSVATIPARVPYLAAPEARRVAWAARLGAATPGRRRVALCWSGNPAYSADMFRSVPLSAMAPLLGAPGVELFLVQTDIRAGDDAVVAAHPGVVDLRRELGDLTDTAAVLERMDLVISVDSAVAHLAGALARPLWVLLPYMADWRWLEERTDSPWYPTARLFRQPRFGDWGPVVAAVQAALRAG